MPRVLVTGASRGIGRAIAIEAASRGHDVVATARNPADVHGLAAMPLALDVTDPDSIRTAIDRAGPVDVAINAAGVTGRAPVEALPPQTLRHIFEVNTLGPVLLTQQVLPAMRQRGGGAIVTLSSMAPRFVPPLHGAYAASKHALETLHVALRYELERFGIRTTTIIVGDVDHEMRNGLPVRRLPPYRPLVEQVEQRLRGHQARPRQGTDDVARDVVDVIDRGVYPERVWIAPVPQRLIASAPASLTTRLARLGITW